MKVTVPDYIMSLKAYKPGKPIEELEREYGIKNSIKLASNENPLGPPASAVAAIKDAAGNIHRYPDGGGFVLSRKIAEKTGVLPENIVLGNGSDDIIGFLSRAFLAPGDEAVMTLPSFLMYEIMVKSAGATAVMIPLQDASHSFGTDLDEMLTRITPKTRMVFLTNPNNPTGAIITKEAFESFLNALPDGIVLVMDEAYIEFADKLQCVSGIDYLDNRVPVIVLRTFSKLYGLAGIRVGYGIMSSGLSEVLHRVRQPFNVNSLAQAAAIAALDDDDYLKKTEMVISEGLEYLYKALDKLGIDYFPTQANFFLIDVKQDADVVFEKMLRQGVIVRSMCSYGYPEYIRLTVGLPEENRRFIDAFEKVMTS